MDKTRKGLGAVVLVVLVTLVIAGCGSGVVSSNTPETEAAIAFDTSANADAAFVAAMESCETVVNELYAFEHNVAVHIDDDCFYVRQAKPVYGGVFTCFWKLPKPDDQNLRSARTYYQSSITSYVKGINLWLDVCAGTGTTREETVSMLFENAGSAWSSGHNHMAAYTPKPAAAVVAPTAKPAAAVLAPAPKHARTEAVVTRIVDGDTIEVAIAGQTYPLRYIGIDTPERGQLGGSEAAEANRQLVAGKTVFLEKDVSDTDRYGRLLRYVYLSNGTFVNAELVSLGVASAKDYPPDSKYRRLLASRQQSAVDKHLGIWKPPSSTTAPQRGRNCSPCYPDVCIPPSPPDLDCGEISYRRFRVVGCDPHRFDGDNDGIGCER